MIETGFNYRVGDMDLVAFQTQWVDFHLGLSIWITLPTYKLYNDTQDWHRCFQFHFGLLFFFFEINIPLWFEEKAGEPE